MALTKDGKKLLPLLEQPLTGADPKTLLIHEFNIESREYTRQRYLYSLDPRGTNIGDFIMYDDKHGLVIERDNSQGDLNGFKRIYEIELNGNGQPVKKTLAVDLLNIGDPNGISEPTLPGDVDTGKTLPSIPDHRRRAFPRYNAHRRFKR